MKYKKKGEKSPSIYFSIKYVFFQCRVETYYQLERLALAGGLAVPVLVCFSLANIFKWTEESTIVRVRDAENQKSAEERKKYLGKVIRVSDLQSLSEIKTEEKKKIPPSVNRLGGKKRWSSKKTILRQIHKN